MGPDGYINPYDNVRNTSLTLFVRLHVLFGGLLHLLGIFNSILKFFQVDSIGMCRMTSSARYFKYGVGSNRPN